MRFDTHRISAYLVRELLWARHTIVDDGGDIVQLITPSGDQIRLYLIENLLQLYEMRGILDANTREDIHTLFILWCDMLLPSQGIRYRPEVFMAALMALNDDVIYAFDAYGAECFIFPVYFDGYGLERSIRYGGTIDARHLVGNWVDAHFVGVSGTWRMATFELDSKAPPADPRVTALAAHYQALGVALDATREVIKRAYRNLARLYHPDVNDDPAAHALMQKINAAYDAIQNELDSDEL